MIKVAAVQLHSSQDAVTILVHSWASRNLHCGIDCCIALSMHTAYICREQACV